MAGIYIYLSLISDLLNFIFDIGKLYFE